MNRTKIEWTEFTLNPIVGCVRNCSYCYGRESNDHYKWIKDWTKPQYFPNRLDQPGKRNIASRIFVCSMSDLFGDGVKTEWTQAVFDMMKRYSWHTYQILTKCPERLAEFEYSPTTKIWDNYRPNIEVGATVDSADAVKRIDYLKKSRAKTKFISFEPLLSEMPKMNLKGVDWVIIGALTGRKGAQPDRRWVQGIIDQAREYKIPVFLKNNLYWPVKIQEYPPVTQYMIDHNHKIRVDGRRWVGAS